MILSTSSRRSAIIRPRAAGTRYRRARTATDPVGKVVHLRPASVGHAADGGTERPQRRFLPCTASMSLCSSTLRPHPMKWPVGSVTMVTLHS